MSESADNRGLLAWAGACAAALETTRHVWKEFRGRTPRGWARASFIVPAAAITGAFLAGAWYLSRRRAGDGKEMIH